MCWVYWMCCVGCVGCAGCVNRHVCLFSQVLLNLPVDGAVASDLLEQYVVGDDDPRKELHGQLGLRARQGVVVPANKLLAPYKGKLSFQFE